VKQVWWVELELEEDDSYEPTMNEIIRDIINGKITNEEEETLCAEALAQKQAQNAVEVAAELVKDKDAELKKLEEPPDAFMCPITKEIMLDPVIDKEGNSYERAAIMEWLRNHNTSPVTRNPLSQDDLTENRALKNAIHEYYEKTGQEMPEPPAVSAEATPAAAAAAAAGAAAVATAAAAPVQQQVFNLNTPEGQAAADAHFAQLAQLQAADEEQQEQEQPTTAAAAAEEAFIESYLDQLDSDDEPNEDFDEEQLGNHMIYQQRLMEEAMVARSHGYAQAHGGVGFPSIDGDWHVDVGVLGELLEEHFDHPEPVAAAAAAPVQQQVVCDGCGQPITGEVHEMSHGEYHYCDGCYDPIGQCQQCGIELHVNWDIYIYGSEDAGFRDYCRPCGRNGDPQQRPQIPPVEELENIQALFSELSDNGGMSDDEARDAFSNYLDGFGIDIDVYMRMLDQRRNARQLDH